MKRYEKIVLEAESGITFKTFEKTEGELIIKAQKSPTANVYSQNYADPPIPMGYGYVCGTWYNGYVIKRNYDGSQFVWIPVGSIAGNGTLDNGDHFIEKFGRRNYRNDKLSEFEFRELQTTMLSEQIESVKKYGGFYISRYNISKNTGGLPQSIKDAIPWTNIGYREAEKIASMFEIGETVKSHLTFGAEFDSILEWFVQMDVASVNDISKDSTNLGNYSNKQNSDGKLSKTGNGEKMSINNICDFIGNVAEFTQEMYGCCYHVIRGGSHKDNGDKYPVAYRGIVNDEFSRCDVGFRIALDIK